MALIACPSEELRTERSRGVSGFPSGAGDQRGTKLLGGLSDGFLGEHLSDAADLGSDRF